MKIKVKNKTIEIMSVYQVRVYMINNDMNIWGKKSSTSFHSIGDVDLDHVDPGPGTTKRFMPTAIDGALLDKIQLWH